jgi:hypothetical protein
MIGCKISTHRHIWLPHDGYSGSLYNSKFVTVEWNSKVYNKNQRVIERNLDRNWKKKALVRKIKTPLVRNQERKRNHW